MSLDEIRVFLKASEAVHFEGEKKEEVYAWVSACLGQQKWDELGRTARGLLRRYMEKMTGLSRAQITRLITRYGEDGEVRVKRSRRHRFGTVYSREDVALLVSVDEMHETLSGPATQKILQRQFYDFGEQRYRRLARISVAQIYRLRQSAGYRKQRVVYQGTRTVQVAIGERRAPQPGGRPGYLRVDTVHQGGRDGAKGGYHINAVDEVTQWEGAWGVIGGGHRASGGSGRGEGGLSHQCGGRSDAMGGGERHCADQRSGSQASAGGHAAAVSLPHSGVSFRQRQRVHQPRRGRVAQQTADRADQEPAAALQ